MRPLQLLIAMGIFSSLFGCKKPSAELNPELGSSGYQFDQPESTACFSCRHVIKEGAPILYISHDADDGVWQFLCGGNHIEDDAKIVGMGEIVKIDPSVNELHEMPEGVSATRDKRGGTWTTFRK